MHVFVATVIAALSLTWSAAAQDPVFDELYRLADDVNGQLPITVDANTRLDTAGVLNGKMLYSYTLFVDDERLYQSSAFKDKFAHQIVTSIMPQLCQAAEMRFYRDNGISHIYSYYLSGGEHVLAVIIDPADCPG